MKKRIFTILFYIYIVFLILFIVLKFDGSFEKIIALHHKYNEQDGIKNINLVSFRSILPYLKNITEPYAFKNIIGNIIIFILLGFFVSNRFSKKIFKPIIICVVAILAIECIEFIFKIGFFDIDDIILNLAGCLLGICVHLFLDKIDILREKG